jgi:DNA-binding XRE family transcriptional regulator
MSSFHSRNFSDYLLEFQSKLEWTDEDMADHLKLTQKEWDKIATGSKEPSLMALSSFAENVDVDLETLFQQNLDFNTLQKRLNEGNVNAIPDRYIPGAFSRARTSRTLLEFIEFYFGWRMRQKVLKTLNMNEASIADPERLINIHFFMDICKSMKTLGYSDEVLRRMGEFSIYSNRGGVVGKMFADCSSPKDVYERFVPILGDYFEKNHTYRILSLGENHCTMEAKVQQQVAHELKVDKIGSLQGCVTRAGVGASFALYAGPFNTTVHEIECMHLGSHRCVFRIEWQPLMQPSCVQ